MYVTCLEFVGLGTPLSEAGTWALLGTPDPGFPKPPGLVFGAQAQTFFLLGANAFEIAPAMFGFSPLTRLKLLT